MSAGEYSGLRVSAPNGVKVYQVTSGKDAPKWLSEKNKRKLRKDAEYGRRVELVQDLEFTCASSRVKLSPDGNFLCVTGIHPPQVKVYDLSQLSMKFERHLDSEVVDFEVLGEDYSKLAFMCADRSINFHAKFGKYYSTRTPRQGRDMTYVRHTGDLLVVGSSSEVYRLNLEQGRFLNPMRAATSEGLNCVDVSNEHGLIAVGTEDGTVECFDSRTREAVGTLRVTKSGPEGLGQGVTALKHDPTGMHLAAGDHDGIVRLYDLRSSRPLIEKDHMYGSPIVDVKYHTAVDGTRRVMSTDKRIVKFWDPNSGANYTAIEPGQEINDACAWDGTGLMVLALENRTPGCYFAPSLGAAPRWCSFLENLTEEMEENTAGNAYDDYRFVTREELERLGMQNLIGTKMLRAYMHGFFVDNRLYGKAKAIAEPFSYDEYRARKVEEKLAEERATRITVKKKLPKVNAALAARLEKAAEEEGGKDGKKKRSRDSGAGAATRRDEESDGEDAADAGAREGGLLKDDRFAAMFKDSAFEVDEDSETYRMLHPNAPKLTKREREEMLEEHFDLESEDEDEDAEEEEDEAEADAEAARAARRRSAAVAKVKMYAAKDERHASAFREGRRDVSSTLTLAERAAQLAATSGKKTRVSGNKELRFEAGERGGRETVRARARASPAGTDRTGPPSRRGRRAGGAIRSRNGAGWGECCPGEAAGGKADAEEAAGRDGETMEDLVQ
jgi:ribosome biogenesis protein ENP2